VTGGLVSVIVEMKTSSTCIQQMCNRSHPDHLRVTQPFLPVGLEHLQPVWKRLTLLSAACNARQFVRRILQQRTVQGPNDIRARQADIRELAIIHIQQLRSCSTMADQP